MEIREGCDIIVNCNPISLPLGNSGLGLVVLVGVARPIRGLTYFYIQSGSNKPDRNLLKLVVTKVTHVLAIQ